MLSMSDDDEFCFVCWLLEGIEQRVLEKWGIGINIALTGLTVACVMRGEFLF
jgi:tRNA G37 N-methylase TrmD